MEEEQEKEGIESEGERGGLERGGGGSVGRKFVVCCVCCLKLQELMTRSGPCNCESSGRRGNYTQNLISAFFLNSFWAAFSFFFYSFLLSCLC